ncbi:MAG TPA: TIR domain-containing protein, partial [Solirubrobacteraceae bacterium]
MLQVSIPIAHELLGQCIKQGQALVQRASLVGDFSDYESWKAARRQWIEPTEQALEHMYGGPGEAREFIDAVVCVEGVKRWQEQYSTDLKCVEQALELLTVLRGDLAFVEGEASGAGGQFGMAAAELGPGVATEGPPPVEQQPDGRTTEHELLGAADQRTSGSPGEQIVHEESAEQAMPKQADERENGRRFDEPLAQPTPSERPVSAELEPAQRISSELTHHAAESTPAERDPAGMPAPARAQQVLLAHGRDERWKQAVEHLLEQAGEHEIRIVNQRAGERSRLTEVFGEETPGSPNSRYAVILLTADDVGGPRLESADEP